MIALMITVYLLWSALLFFPDLDCSTDVYLSFPCYWCSTRFLGLLPEINARTYAGTRVCVRQINHLYRMNNSSDSINVC